MSDCYIIGEAGINHNGSIDKAKELVDAAVLAGVSAVKFQLWNSDSLFSDKSKDYHDAKLLELSLEDFRNLKAYCDDKSMTFLCTPDDEESLNFLVDELKISAVKVGSGELNNLPFLTKIGEKGLPIILSTGMGTLEEVDEAVKTIMKTGNKKITLLHCTSSYPTALKDVNLKAMLTLKEKFHLPVGYSDHTEGLMAAYSAALLGGSIIEKHFSLNKNDPFGPDHQTSIEPDELKELVTTIRRAEAILGNGRKEPTESEMINRVRVRKSIVAGRDIPEGKIILDEDLAYKRPGNGLPPNKKDYVVGKKATVDIKKDERIIMMVRE
jgi:N,N'-diacetyllegionaminate synthase